MGVSVVVGDKGRVTLPPSVRKHLKIAAGDQLEVELSADGTVELVPLALIPRDQIWFAHPQMHKRIVEALDDISHGRTTRMSKRSEVRPSLNKLKKARRSK